MEHIIWHFPKPLHEKRKLSELEEQKLFYRLAQDFTSMLDREVIINNHIPIDFNKRVTYIYYKSVGFQLTIALKRDWELNHHECDQANLKICFFMVEPKNIGIGSRIIKHFIKEVATTNFQYITLDTRDEDGRRFWKRLGFSPKGDLKDQIDWYLKLPK
ncbi:GNAT family N-acetyltransferase [Falsibacillus pallidus]|uniref:Acetyltransferase (GNAT) family protein n=1 Tax=Falsibacillus pallidus TaxID=493781 RepID=A0A370GCX3_9BACI|nr:hypothetical protein [Falsibacillus pallidus]RDI40919.1 hypothetical protein DFR59_11162 [Falsibacillus pallidus]